MNPGKTIPAIQKKLRGFSDEEESVAQARVKELKAEVRANENKADGEMAALVKKAVG